MLGQVLLPPRYVGDDCGPPVLPAAAMLSPCGAPAAGFRPPAARGIHAVAQPLEPVTAGACPGPRFLTMAPDMREVSIAQRERKVRPPLCPSGVV